MTESMMAYCGLDCAECPAYLALKNNDDELRKIQAAKWGSPDFPVSPDDINCVGCKTKGEPKFKFCGSCTVRGCASERGVETCAHCEEYVCDTLKSWLAMAGDEHRQRLESLRAAL